MLDGHWPLSNNVSSKVSWLVAVYKVLAFTTIARIRVADDASLTVTRSLASHSADLNSLVLSPRCSGSTASGASIARPEDGRGDVGIVSSEDFSSQRKVRERFIPVMLAIDFVTDIVCQDSCDFDEFHSVVDLPPVSVPANILAVVAVGALDDAVELRPIVSNDMLLFVSAMRKPVGQWQRTTMLEPISHLLLRTTTTRTSLVHSTTWAHVYDDLDDGPDPDAVRGAVLSHSSTP